ncbi:hypothetical protein BGZ61DRAFT_177252 [Ilyonectria robusta]|uniref:uncharacterized protein n=1 Tax=Ilyonectria robusta TaxID=1079257 RepID=UPI001E8E4BE4|nr:uncharacterized protein BGZ61DRAFT_177252 [Ilyonectria robusta]KAH8656749.1 hypothetical protein BGZ61DRAFT_177252 [Ilyonectria robusta]
MAMAMDQYVDNAVVGIASQPADTQPSAEATPCTPSPLQCAWGDVVFYIICRSSSVCIILGEKWGYPNFQIKSNWRLDLERPTRVNGRTDKSMRAWPTRKEGSSAV